MSTVFSNDYVIEQGEDAVWAITYSVAGQPIDNTWQARMDIAPKSGGATTTIWSFNSVDFTGGVDDEGKPLDQPGEQDNEITISATGEIAISISRSLTLPGGKLGDKLASGVTDFSYDLFVRDGSGGQQTKVMQGSIKVNKSITIWP